MFWLKEISSLASFGVPVLIILLGWNNQVAAILGNVTRSLSLQVAAIWACTYAPILVIGCATAAVSFYVDRKFSLTSSSLGRCLVDFLKASGIVFAFLLAMLETVYSAFAITPRFWWLLAGTAIGLIYAVILYIAPSVILPMFFRSTPLKDPALIEKVSYLCNLARLEAQSVAILHISNKTHKSNAVVLGWGRAKRIYLTDTLIKELNVDEIEAILAHELGHSVRHDTAKRLLWQAGGFIMVLLAMSWICQIQLVPNVSFNNATSVPTIYLCWLVLTVYLRMVLAKFWRAQERAADLFAWKLTGDVESFISAMQKLMEHNLIGYEKSGSWRFSHPAIPERIQAAREYATRNGLASRNQVPAVVSSQSE